MEESSACHSGQGPVHRETKVPKSHMYVIRRGRSLSSACWRRIPDPRPGIVRERKLERPGRNYEDAVALSTSPGRVLSRLLCSKHLQLQKVRGTASGRNEPIHFMKLRRANHIAPGGLPKIPSFLQLEKKFRLTSEISLLTWKAQDPEENYHIRRPGFTAAPPAA